MSKVLQELLALLKLEAIGVNRFRGRSQDLGFRNLFGGQVLGQSLSAAIQTLNAPTWVPHSLHAYFLRPGNVDDSVEDRKSTRLNSSHVRISYAVFCLKKKKKKQNKNNETIRRNLQIHFNYANQKI